MNDPAEISSHEISWNPQLESIISEEGERAMCFSWLHNHSEKWYSKLNTFITLPVIVMSTIAGTASIGAQGMSDPTNTSASKYASFGIGGISLLVGVLNTVSSYFGWAKRSESHRIAAITYNKVYRFILIELALPRDERMTAKDMLKTIRDQLDRLQETSPPIPDKIILKFREKFSETTPEVKKPEITNGLDPIYVYSEDPASIPPPSPHGTDTQTKDLKMPNRYSLVHPIMRTRLSMIKAQNAAKSPKIPVATSPRRVAPLTSDGFSSVVIDVPPADIAV
jgi:hypothetical protein